MSQATDSEEGLVQSEFGHLDTLTETVRRRGNGLCKESCGCWTFSVLCDHATYTVEQSVKLKRVKATVVLPQNGNYVLHTLITVSCKASEQVNLTYIKTVAQSTLCGM